MKIIFLALFVTIVFIGNAQQIQNPSSIDLIALNGFSFKKGDSVLTRKEFGKEIYQSPEAIRYLKKARLNEGFTVVFAIGSVLSLLHSDIDYRREDQTRRRILNVSGVLLLGTSVLTMKYYLRNMGKAVDVRNKDLLLSY